MQIVRGGKLSWFLQISLQSQKFSSELFLFIMADSGPGSGPVRTHGWNFSGKMPPPLSHLPLYKLRQHIHLLDYLAHFYIQVVRQGWVSNYLDRYRNFECN